MRDKAHRGGIRQRQAAPVRRVLALALSLLMLLASLPMDVTAAVIDRFIAPRVVSETAPDGGVFSYLHDDFGRVVRRSSPQGSVLHEYDEMTGRRVRTTTASGDVSYGYDLLGRLSEVAVARLGGQDFAEPRVTEYSYDVIGARSYVRRWNGVETEYGYDTLDRLVSLEHRGSNGTSIATFSYSYQADGRRSSAVEDTPTGTSVVRYSYDALGRLISETRTGGAHPFSAAYAYDLNGNRLARTVAADGVTEATSYSYDDNDRLLVETTDGAATQYAYDGNGSLVSTDARETKKRGGKGKRKRVSQGSGLRSGCCIVEQMIESGDFLEKIRADLYFPMKSASAATFETRLSDLSQKSLFYFPAQFPAVTSFSNQLRSNWSGVCNFSFRWGRLQL